MMKKVKASISHSCCLPKPRVKHWICTPTFDSSVRDISIMRASPPCSIVPELPDLRSEEYLRGGWSYKGLGWKVRWRPRLWEGIVPTQLLPCTAASLRPLLGLLLPHSHVVLLHDTSLDLVPADQATAGPKYSIPICGMRLNPDPFRSYKFNLAQLLGSQLSMVCIIQALPRCRIEDGSVLFNSACAALNLST